ncbi:serine protease, S1-C subfamily, contains C-terminal PDZ domain [bacterium A37T11]|nr:serine protease, S1-C subfamily, contains C-terminal PDZ domain [bacterium A37T11]
MRKIGITLLAAIVGGTIAVGGYKFFEAKQQNTMSFEERQDLHYASNPSAITSSAGNLDFTQAAAAVSPAVVHIKTTYDRGGAGQDDDSYNPFEEFFGIPRGRRQQAQPAMASGSGVIISDDGYIVTNNHVVEDADKIDVVLTDKRTFEAKVIGRDPNTDLALIKVTAKGLPIVKLGNSDNVQIGEWVLAVGYPLGLESTVTAGIVSAKGRSIGILNNAPRERQQQMPRGWGQPQEDQDQSNQALINTAIESFIQTDAVINKGNSGGALVNAAGELVGINSAIASPSGYYAGYGFAVPVDLVKKIADDFVKFGRVKRGLIGISFRELSPEYAKQLGISEINGLYVNEVVPGGGAEKAGIRKGDIVTKLDGKLIYTSSDLQEKVYRLSPGDKVRLAFKRGGKEQEVTVTLKEDEGATKTAQVDAAKKRSATQIYNKLGAGFIPATAQQKKQLGITSGVVVSQVQEGGLFDENDVPRGMVISKINGRPVNNVDEVENALGEGKEGYVRLEGITPDGGRITATFPVQ